MLLVQSAVYPADAGTVTIMAKRWNSNREAAGFRGRDHPKSGFVLQETGMQESEVSGRHQQGFRSGGNRTAVETVRPGHASSTVKSYSLGM